MANFAQCLLLLELAEKQREEAALQVAKAMQQHQQALERHRQVEQFRQEYHMKWTAATSLGITADAWRNFRLFIDKLNLATEQQNTELSRYEAQLARAQQAWRLCEQKVLTYQTLLKQHKQVQIKQEARSEQRLADDFALSQHRRKNDH